MSWLMTNDMRVIVERSALSVSIMSGCCVSESYFKTKGSDGIQIEWRGFFFFFLRHKMGVDRVVSTVYFLTVAAWLISEKSH